MVNLDVTRAAAPYGYYYASDPSSQQICSIGGNVAENSGGAHCLKYGFTTNHVTGVQLVVPTGDVVQLGGKAPDPPGYDLLGAFVGSEGTLGIATEVTGAFEIRIAADDAERALFWKGRKSAFAAVGQISPDYIVQDGVIPRTALPEVLRRMGGSQVFLRSLGECFARLQERPATEVERREIDALAVALVEHRVELVPGVASTLADLGTRHDLLLLTKGQVTEQQNKVDISGLGHHFRSVHIVAEKNVATYRRLVREESLTPSETWMVGNSPKSDINPARLAGLNAVFLPNENTWILEHDDIDPADDGVLRLTRFPELLEHF